ncbi:hypothetical protein AB0M54_20585 [Actinoplanes sp. NPDC051470]|uniref:hypothetical protein n=1 Tax=Actinoplanes sp. NPDC051470 TaxID=3157224 RepID=UPI003411FC30
MKKIGFLSFGHWRNAAGSETRSAADALLQTIELAEAAEELAADEAVRAADTVLFTVPNQLGVAYNARILETITKHIAPAIGWSRSEST